MTSPKHTRYYITRTVIFQLFISVFITIYYRDPRIDIDMNEKPYEKKSGKVKQYNALLRIIKLIVKHEERITERQPLTMEKPLPADPNEKSP